MRLLSAPDKFRGTLSAQEAAAAIAAGADRAGWSAVELPLADGGEGTLDVIGGGNRRTAVTGPLGDPVEAAWHFDENGTALIEAAQACGLTLAGGPERNDPLARDEPRRRRAHRDSSGRGSRADRRLRGRRGVDRRRSRRHGSRPASAPRPARRGVRRRRALPRGRRLLRAAEGSDAGTGRGSCTSACRRSSSPTCRAPARRAGSPAGWRRSVRASSPASISSPTESASTTSSRTRISS